MCASGGIAVLQSNYHAATDVGILQTAPVDRRQRGAALQHRGDSAPQDLCHEPGLQSQPGARL